MMYLDERKERARKMREEEAKIGPRMIEGSFESNDWSDGTERWPLLVFEYIDGGLDSIYGPYTNTADLMAALKHLDPDGEDPGYEYEIQPLKGKP